MAVGSVRAALVDSFDGLVRDAVITGENETALGALLLLSSSAKAMDPERLASVLTAKLAEATRSATGSASRVVRAMVLESEPSFDRGEVTEKGSLNQRAMRSNHAALIQALYANEGEILTV